jgi:phosphoglycolate phosphatase
MTSGAGPNRASRLCKAVLFDLDGTLLDTIEDIAGAMNRVLAARAYETYGVEKYKLLVGDGIEEMVRRALAPRSLAPSEMDAVIREYRREYEASWRAHSRPYPGIPELLGELRSRGVKTAVLSNKSHPFTVAMTTELLAGFRFDIVRGAIPGIPLKPDPAPALSVAAEMGIAAPQVLFLGDTKVDMKTALAAGMFPAGALWGFRSEAELRSSGAAVLVAAPLDLLPYFPAS